MSLFRAREWWQASCGHGEEFDRGSLCVANIDNDPSGKGASRLSWRAGEGRGGAALKKQRGSLAH